jgi:hypothetical protein
MDRRFFLYCLDHACRNTSRCLVVVADVGSELMSRTAVFILRVVAVVLNIVAALYIIRYASITALNASGMAVVGIILLYIVFNLSAVAAPQNLKLARRVSKALIILPNFMVIVLGWVIALQGSQGIAFGDAVTVALAFTMFPLVNIAAVWVVRTGERKHHKHDDRSKE